MKNVHLTHGDKGWQLMEEGNSKPLATYGGKTKEQSVTAAAEQLAGTGASLKIHLLNGKIEEERTYPRSADPKRSKG